MPVCDPRNGKMLILACWGYCNDKASVLTFLRYIVDHTHCLRQAWERWLNSIEHKVERWLISCRVNKKKWHVNWWKWNDRMKSHHVHNLTCRVESFTYPWDILHILVTAQKGGLGALHAIGQNSCLSHSVQANQISFHTSRASWYQWTVPIGSCWSFPELSPALSPSRKANRSSYILTGWQQLWWCRLDCFYAVGQ